MVEVIDSIYVNEKTMKWLKNEGRNIIMGSVYGFAEDIIDIRNTDNYFNLEIILGGEGKCSDNNHRCNNDCPKKIIIGKDKIQYNISWNGFEKAYEILEFIEIICREEGGSRIINKEIVMKKGLLELMGISYEKKYIKKKKGFLIANCGFGVDVGKWLEKDEIPVRKDIKKKGKKIGRKKIVEEIIKKDMCCSEKKEE